MNRLKYLSLLAQGNIANKDGMHAKAIWYYERAVLENPMLEQLAAFNIAMSRKAMREDSGSTTVEIIIPVYNALDDLQKCLASIKSNVDDLEVRVIVVNDGSASSATEWLREYCAHDPMVYLVENTQNMGYTKSVNIGLKVSSAPYVILQNSDTVVSSGWLDRLMGCMKSSQKIGIVGPLSNAANYQSVPLMRDEQGKFVVNDLPSGVSVEAMAHAVAHISKRAYPRVTLVNGFCFMMRRELIDTIGYMDEVNFPVGYGEEADYCIRALQAGYELAIADDVYVFHAKSKSFGQEQRKELSYAGTQTLKSKYTSEIYFSYGEQMKKSDALETLRSDLLQYLAQNKSNFKGKQ